ncbi:pyridoxal-phosphate dependent enzyme [Pendulispora brunnea]|uniref:Pyridoxal-phosphate dependent enzyme n=1 Tax=Pendulispora brunnea TaxID=2905690 RepID=A0ABZ2K6I7_9BACT
MGYRAGEVPKTFVARLALLAKHARTVSSHSAKIHRGAVRVRSFIDPELAGVIGADRILTTRSCSKKCNDGQQSLRSGSLVHIEIPKTHCRRGTIAALGNLTFEIIKRDVDDILTASDDDLLECMRLFASRMKIIVEPTGCLALAGARRIPESSKVNVWASS